MTDTAPSDTEAEQVRPPRDYPADEWLTDGPYAVPPDLRPFYAAAEPTDLQKRGYVEYGSSVTEPVTVTRQRIVSPGRDDGEPIVTEEPDTVMMFRDLRGPTDYPRWLHLTRLDIAAHAHRAAESLAVMDSYNLTCDVCGVRHGGVQARAVYPGPVHVAGCSEHLPVLEHAARAAVASRDAGRLLPDGRTTGAVAEQVVADRIAAMDGAS